MACSEAESNGGTLGDGGFGDGGAGAGGGVGTDPAGGTPGGGSGAGGGADGSDAGGDPSGGADAGPAPAKDYYVAETGSDTDDGLSLDSPFQTIQRAADVARGGDRVHIRAGTYREVVVPAHEGSVDRPIVFTNYESERVVISGGEIVSDWTRHAGDIWKATVDWNANENRANNTLFVDGDLMIDARHFAEGGPSKVLDIGEWGLLRRGLVSEAGTSIVLAELVGDPDDKWVGAKITYHTADWVLETKTITAFNGTTGAVTLDSPIGPVLQKQDNGFFIYDTLEALDKPGEWYKDSADTLYYHAAPGQDPGSLEIEFKLNGFGFDVRGKDYIHIRGIVFRGVTIYGDEDSDGNTYENNVFYGYGKGVVTDFDRMFINGEGNTFQSNEIYHTFGSAFDLGGTGNRVVNNYLHDLNLSGLGAVLNSRGSDQVIAHNTVKNFGRNFVDGYSVRSVYAYNLIEGGGNLSWDTGAFDSDGGNGNVSQSIFHHNVLRDMNARGIFEGFYGNNSNTVIHHNILYNWGSGGTERSPLRARGLDFRQVYHNTVIGPSPEGAQDARHAVVTRYNNNLHLSIDRMEAIGVDVRGNYSYAPEEFQDFAGGDFRLMADSGAIDVGIALPGVNDGTLGSTPHSGAAPDAGALEFGQEMWKVGHDFEALPAPTASWFPIPGMNLVPNGQFTEGLGQWEPTAGAPRVEDFNSWNLKGGRFAQSGQSIVASLTGTFRTKSVELIPGQGLRQTFTGLSPDSTYTLGAAVRVIQEVVPRGDMYDGSSGTIRTGQHRSQHYFSDLTAGEWVQFDAIDFGNAGQFDQLELVMKRAIGATSFSGTTVQVHLDSPTGPLLVEFSGDDLTDSESWIARTKAISSTSGAHALYISASGDNSNNLEISAVRLLKATLPDDEKTTITVDSSGAPSQRKTFGNSVWEDAYDTFLFATGPNADAVTIEIQNDGSTNAYLDRIYVVEGDLVSAGADNDLAREFGLATQSSTAGGRSASAALDGSATTYSETQDAADSWWQVSFAQHFLLGKIELLNTSANTFGDLSNFTVSVWDGDPDSGANKLWEKTYFASGSVPQSGVLEVLGSERSLDNRTRLSSAVGRVVRIQLNGRNQNANGNLPLAGVRVFEAKHAMAEKNVAYRSVPAQSTDHYITWRLADRAIDGRYDLFTHTQLIAAQWWQTQLPQATQIDQAVLFNTTQAAPYRISVWSSDPRLGGSALWTKDLNVGENEALTVEGSETSAGARLDGVANAAYVRIDRLNSGPVAFRQIQIWED